TGDNDTAGPIAREVVTAASAIGDAQLRGRALAIQGTADAHSSHPSGNGRAILEEAIDLLVAANSVEQLSAQTYLGVLQGEEGDLGGYIATCERIAAAVERFGVPRMLDLLAVWRMDEQYWTGRWDAILSGLDSVTDRYDRVFGGWLASRVLWARGDRDRAMSECQAGLEYARGVGDLQLLLPALVLSARLTSLGGGDPTPLIEELAPKWGAVWNLATLLLGADLAYLFADIPQGRQLAAQVRRPPGGSGWVDALEAVMRGDHAEAAAIYGRMGSLADHAYAGLHAEPPAPGAREFAN